MFKRLYEPKTAVNFDFEGETVSSAEGETVAAALLAHGVGHTRRSVVSSSPRAPYCMIGACFECRSRSTDAPTDRPA